MQEPEILAHIAAGDTDSFGLLYDAYSERIYRYFFYRTHDRALAEDLTSATFFKAVHNIKGFNAKKGNFSAWLYRIARNTFFDHLRTNHRSEPIEAAEKVLDTAPTIEENLIDRDLVQKVKESFAQLTQEQREIVTMRVWDELTYAEIANILGKNEASCKMMFYRATVKLRTIASLTAAFLILFPSLEKFLK